VVGVLRSVPVVALALSVVGVLPSAAFASSAAGAAVRPVVFAVAPAGASKPDDITVMGGVLYVTYQNNAGNDGSPAGSRSTVVAFDAAGTVKQTWSVPGRVDGLTADPRHGRVFATANEDLNSSLFLITPTSKGLQHLTFSPDPAQKGSDGSNGGTDSVSVGTDGTVYVAHSNPDPKLPAPNNPAAVYKMTIAGASATLTPLFNVNDTAPVMNPAAAAPRSAPLGLTDPDSNRIIASSGGDMLIQDAQADSKLVFATHLSSGSPSLAQLNLVNAGGKAGGPTPQLDDIEQVTGPGTLYMVDQGSGKIYAMDTATVTPGTYFVSQPKPSKGDLPNRADVATLNIHTGVVTDLHTGLISPKGLLFLPKAATAPTSTATPGTTSAAATSTGGTGTGSPTVETVTATVDGQMTTTQFPLPSGGNAGRGGGSSTLAIIGSLMGLLILAGGWTMRIRQRRTSQPGRAH